MVAVEKDDAGTRRRVVIAPPRPVGRRAPAVHPRPAPPPAPLRSEPAAPPRTPAPLPPAVKRSEPREATPAASVDGPSPTTNIRSVMITFAVGLLLAAVFGARGLVHAGRGMDPGLERTVTLAIGEPIEAVTGAMRITAPWDAAESALGRSPTDSTSPLLSASHAVTPSKPSTHPTAPHAKPLPVTSPRHPLRLLVTGDSLTEYLGPQLVEEATQAGPVNASSDTHYGTGIVRPDFVDWASVARQQVARYHPQAVVVFMGGNDDQNITLADGSIVDRGTQRWTAEYARRVEVVMRQWLSGGARRVYWLSMPPARDDGWSAVNHQINVAIAEAAAHLPGARFVDVLGPVTNHGRYADFVSVNGTEQLVRTPDGIHFNSDGSDIVSHEVLNLLVKEWHLGKKRPPTKGRQPAGPKVRS